LWVWCRSWPSAARAATWDQQQRQQQLSVKLKIDQSRVPVVTEQLSGQLGEGLACLLQEHLALARGPVSRVGPDKVVAALDSRFMPGMSEGACVQHVLRLISSSLDAWSTRQYDYYQRVLNGIL